MLRWETAIRSAIIVAIMAFVLSHCLFYRSPFTFSICVIFPLAAFASTLLPCGIPFLRCVIVIATPFILTLLALSYPRTSNYYPNDLVATRTSRDGENRKW